MPKKNYIEFGLVSSNNKKKPYELLNGDLYDFYMLGRYFNDIYNLNLLIQKKKFSTSLFHDTKDLKFNILNYLLLKLSRKKKFYEFGFTLYEKIYYFKYFDTFFKNKLLINSIQFNGSDISKKFIFFSENFYKNLKINLSSKVRKNLFYNSVFFSKGITLLYEKKNINYLNNFIKNCDSGSFDISLYPQRRVVSLNTGYKLYYPSFADFTKLIVGSHKTFFFRNKKKK